MRRRAVIGLGAICALATAGGVSTAALSDHGTLAAFESRLDGYCASVGHRHAVGTTFGDRELSGVATTDSLECNMLSGFVDVVAFTSTPARARALAGAGADADGACLIGPREAVFADLLAPGMDRQFRRWCSDLGGRLA